MMNDYLAGINTVEQLIAMHNTNNYLANEITPEITALYTDIFNAMKNTNNMTKETAKEFANRAAAINKTVKLDVRVLCGMYYNYHKA